MQTSQLGLSLGSGLELRRFNITYEDLTDSDTSQAITLFTMSKGSAILGVRIKHSTAFSGGTVSSMTVSVDSTAGGVAFFATAYDIYQAAAATTFQLSDQFKAGTYASDIVTATFTSGGGNVTDTTAGSVDIDILLMNVTTPL